VIAHRQAASRRANTSFAPTCGQRECPNVVWFDLVTSSLGHPAGAKELLQLQEDVMVGAVAPDVEHVFEFQ